MTVTQLVGFLALNIVTIAFSLLYIRFASPVGVSFYELGITGTLLDIIINLVLMLFAFRRRKYVLISQNITAADENKNADEDLSTCQAATGEN